jgi:DNA repair photolyase
MILYSCTVLRVDDPRKTARKGRGALSNPAGRFERTGIEVIDDGWHQEDVSESIETTVQPDRARTVITTNDSPDIGFEQSINPYRGCEHACVYCAAGETPILLANGRTRRLGDVRIGDDIYGTVRQGRYRSYIQTQVTAQWSVIKPAYRVTLEDGTELITSGDHRFLTDRGWKFVTGKEQGPEQRPFLTLNNKLMGTGAFAQAPDKDVDHRRGYLCGLIRGDGTLGSYGQPRASGGRGRVHLFRFALCDVEALRRAEDWLRGWQVETRSFLFSAASANRRAMHAIRASSRSRIESIRELIGWPTAATRSWRAGFLAGIFDAEGSYSSGIIRICNTDPEIIAWIRESLLALDFRFVLEHIHHENRKPIDVVRIVGGLREHLRFFHSVDPAITRKRDISDQCVKSEARLKVVSIEPLGRAMRLYDITTGTGDFIANGVISHNCYARPSHAYMGLSSGLDFETKLFYKADVGQRLTAELARPGYICKPIALGSNTDPYQPVEKRLEVTRTILQVLWECRHPVTIVSKGTLVLRDLPLLADMARLGLAHVTVSLTSLDPEIKRTLEPRAASPQARIRVIEQLSGAGIPVGVLVAPVIPVITDHELESLVETAVGAGARSVGYVMLRLPYEVKDLFREWLAAHYPQRAQHVMSIIQSIRGGRDNDPRFGTRMRGEGPFADLLRNRFKLALQRSGIATSARQPLVTTLFRPPRKNSPQLDLGL